MGAADRHDWANLNTTQRGYGNAHQKRRKQWAPAVARGEVVCWRCGKQIRPGTPWDLGHADGSRHEYAGPEHTACNRGAAGRLAQQRRLGREFDPPAAW